MQPEPTQFSHLPTFAQFQFQPGQGYSGGTFIKLSASQAYRESDNRLMNVPPPAAVSREPNLVALTPTSRLETRQRHILAVLTSANTPPEGLTLSQLWSRYYARVMEQSRFSHPLIVERYFRDAARGLVAGGEIHWTTSGGITETKAQIFHGAMHRADLYSATPRGLILAVRYGVHPDQ